MSKDLIGPYKVLRLVKQGGGGSVYVAHDQRLQRRVALKFIALPIQGERRQQFVAEARTLAAVSHRLIVQIFDVVELGKHIVLVMEYVPGTDLADLIKLQSLDLNSILQIAMDLSGALAAVHELGIVHGDIKPDNVLLDLAGRARLSDFGIAQVDAVAPDAAPDVIQGSLLALAPEQVNGAIADSRSDLFAFGLLLYRLIAGSHPFQGHCDEHAFLHRLCEDAALPLSQVKQGVPERLNSLVQKLLEKNPQRRPASALWVRQELALVRSELPIDRVDRLAQQVGDAARPEDAVPTSNELPSGVSGSARSHVLSDLQWRPWNHTGEQRWRRLALVAIAAMVALTTFLWWPQQVAQQVHSVTVARPQVMLVGGAVAAMSADDLSHMLRRALAAHPQLEHNPGPAPDVLMLQVRCNPYACGVLLRHQSRGSSPRVNYSTLLLEAPREAWQSSLSGAVATLFEP